MSVSVIFENLTFAMSLFFLFDKSNSSNFQMCFISTIIAYQCPNIKDIV